MLLWTIVYRAYVARPDYHRCAGQKIANDLGAVVDKCKVFEAASANKRLLERKAEKLETKVDSIDATTSVTDIVRKRTCYNCGRTFVANYLESCPAKNVECHSCHKKGHFARYCRQPKSGESSNRSAAKTNRSESNAKSVKQINWGDIGNDCFVNLSVIDAANSPIKDCCVFTNCSINTNRGRMDAINQSGSWYKTFRIHDQQIRFKLDTGADVSCIPIGFLNQLPGHCIGQIRRSDNVLTDYGSNKLNLHGTINLDCFDNERLIACSVLFHIVDNTFETLLGLPGCISLGLVRRVS